MAGGGLFLCVGAEAEKQEPLGAGSHPRGGLPQIATAGEFVGTEVRPQCSKSEWEIRKSALKNLATMGRSEKSGNQSG